MTYQMAPDSEEHFPELPQLGHLKAQPPNLPFNNPRFFLDSVGNTGLTLPTALLHQTFNRGTVSSSRLNERKYKYK
jgi:hypothetical protein